MFMQADKRLFDTQMVKEHAAVPGILGGNKIGFPEGFNGPQRDILAISDRGGDDGQHGSFPGLGLPALSELDGNVIRQVAGGVGQSLPLDRIEVVAAKKRRGP